MGSIVMWADNDNGIIISNHVNHSNGNVGLAERHQVYMMQITSLQTGLF